MLVATAYMEEAEQYDWLVAVDSGRVLATGTPAELLARTGTSSLEEAFLSLLPAERRSGHTALTIPPLAAGEVVIEAKGLQMRFGDFIAVDDVNLQVRRGEIFGFLGSNGCGKSTTMKMLTGLLPPTKGEARLLGEVLDADNIETRRHVGYMSQAFSLYGELSVRRNLELHARLFRLSMAEGEARILELAKRFDLTPVMDALPDALPLGIRQRLQLAVAVLHRPDVLILDEPTSGVDPVARDHFWELIIDLSRKDGVTIFITTHFMNEAQRCDRISLMHAGRILASAAPAELIARRGAASLEEAAIPVLKGTKSETERFAGAQITTSIEAMMWDKRALQSGTSHYFGDNFAKAFEIQFLNKDNKLTYAQTTSWAISSRIIGAMIMVHGDDNGLVLPPRLAPIQAVVVPIFKNDAEKEKVMEVADRLFAELKTAGVRVKFDDRDNVSSGFKFNDWEMRGVPVRVEIGPKDVEKGTVALARREAVPVPSLMAGTVVIQNYYSVSTTVGLTVPIPVFDWGQGLRARAEARAIASKREREAVSAEVEAELVRAAQVLKLRRDALGDYEARVVAQAERMRSLADDGRWHPTAFARPVLHAGITAIEVDGEGVSIADSNGGRAPSLPILPRVGLLDASTASLGIARAMSAWRPSDSEPQHSPARALAPVYPPYYPPYYPPQNP